VLPKCALIVLPDFRFQINRDRLFSKDIKGINTPGQRGKPNYGISSRKIKIDAKPSNPIIFQNLPASSLFLTHI
jgi:hypothetical protein